MSASTKAKTEKKIENRWITIKENIKIVKTEADETNTVIIFTAECEKSRIKVKARKRNKNIIWKVRHIKIMNERETSSM